MAVVEMLATCLPVNPKELKANNVDICCVFKVATWLVLKDCT